MRLEFAFSVGVFFNVIFSFVFAGFFFVVSDFLAKRNMAVVSFERAKCRKFMALNALFLLLFCLLASTGKFCKQ